MILPRRPILKCVHPWNQARNYFGKWTSGNLMPLEPGPSQRSLSTYHFLPLFQWPKIQKLLSGKWLCLHELHWPRVQHVWAPGEGSMAGLCHSPHHWLTPVTLSLPCLVTHTLCHLPGLAQQSAAYASSRLLQSQWEAGGPWQQWHPAEQGKTLPETALSTTCCKNQPSWSLFLIASCLAAKNTTFANQPRLRWQGATGKVALQSSTPFPLL